MNSIHYDSQSTSAGTEYTWTQWTLYNNEIVSLNGRHDIILILGLHKLKWKIYPHVTKFELLVIKLELANNVFPEKKPRKC